MDPQALDINLLTALDILLQERSVGRAARRLALSQPATSRVLARLREAFDDELLVRQGRTMVPTPKAARLAGPLRQALATLRRVVQDGGAFEPASTQRRFVLSTHNLAQATTLPRLCARLAEQAPGAELVVTPYDPAFERELEQGRFDLVVAGRPGNVEWISSRRLYREGWACLQGPGLSGGPLTLETFLAHPHVMVSPSGEGEGIVDTVLGDRGLSRPSVLRVPDFAGGLLLVAQSAAVMTVPRSFGRVAAGLLPVELVDPPLPLPELRVYLSWHQRFDEDPAHRWFRELVIECTRDLNDGEAESPGEG